MVQRNRDFTLEDIEMANVHTKRYLTSAIKEMQMQNAPQWMSLDTYQDGLKKKKVANTKC